MPQRGKMYAENKLLFKMIVIVSGIEEWAFIFLGVSD